MPGLRSLDAGEFNSSEIKSFPFLGDAEKKEIVSRAGHTDKESVLAAATRVQKILTESGEPASFVPGAIFIEFGSDDLFLVLVDERSDQKIGQEKQSRTGHDEERRVPEVEP